jgi:acetyl esterase
MPLEPVSREFVDASLASGDLPIDQWTPGILRLGEIVMAGVSGPGPEVGSVENLKLAAPTGEFRIRILRPRGPSGAIVVYFHGGGWVISDIDLQYDNIWRQLANLSQATVVLVNYRKAPEHPFPTALTDSYAALEWVAAHAAELAPHGVPLVVAGDSAGGNIAAVMTQWARDRLGPKIDLQVLVYPVTDCDFTRPSYLAEENQLLLTSDAMKWFWRQYLPDEAARKHPDASPLRAQCHVDLPPALVYVAEYDPLHDEGVAYAEALEAAGVPVTLEEATGEMHTFIQMANVLPGCDRGLAVIADFIKQSTRHVAHEVLHHA